MKVKDLLNSPERWTKGAMKRDANGNNLGDRLNWEKACSFCLWGAINYVYDEGERFEIKNRLRPIIQKRSNYKFFTITGYNDDPATKFEDIQAVMNEADI